MDPELKTIPVGESELLRDGDDALVVAVGSIVHPALEAAAELASEGISVAVVNARFVKPLDGDRIVPLARRCAVVLTVEEHGGPGGFGSALLEVLAAARVTVPTHCLALPDRILEHGESLAGHGLDNIGIARAVRTLLGRPEPS